MLNIKKPGPEGPGELDRERSLGERLEASSTYPNPLSSTVTRVTTGDFF
jgi:hypothetical protein